MEEAPGLGSVDKLNHTNHWFETLAQGLSLDRLSPPAPTFCQTFADESVRPSAIHVTDISITQLINVGPRELALYRRMSFLHSLGRPHLLFDFTIGSVFR